MEEFQHGGSSLANASSVRAYPKLIHYNKLEKGSHFAAWEQPQTIDNKIEKSFELNGGLFGLGAE